MENQWKQDLQSPTDKWLWNIEPRVYGYVNQIGNGTRYCWQAVRGDFRLAGIETDREAAMARAEEMLALPIEEFNQRVVDDLLEEVKRLEQDILRLSQRPGLLPGYHAGYEAGATDVKRKVAAAMELAGNN